MNESIPPAEFTLRGDDSMMNNSAMAQQQDQKMEEEDEPELQQPEFKINSVLKDFSANIKNYRKYSDKEKVLPQKSI